MEVKEVAERLGVHVNTIYTQITNKQIKATKKGRSWDIPEEEFQRLKARQKLTPRVQIESLNHVLDMIEVRLELYKDMLELDMWLITSNKEEDMSKKTDKVVKVISKEYPRIKKFEDIKVELEKIRDLIYLDINEGKLEMDQVVHIDLQREQLQERLKEEVYQRLKGVKKEE